MADPLDSGDDVSVTVRPIPSRNPRVNLVSYSDLRQTQEGRGPKVAGGEDETCKREGIGTIREGSAKAGRAGSILRFAPFLEGAIGGLIHSPDSR